MTQSYSAIVVGTSFASSFFLLEHLKHQGPDARVLVLERGNRRSHQQMFDEQRHSDFEADDIMINRHPRKKWVSNIVFGGNSNCWWACTPRMLPADFELKTRYGVGEDWPIKYDELEPYYGEVEEIMQISGPDYGGHLFPRSRPYPQPPHRLSSPDRVLQAAHPDRFFAQPTARARRATAHRTACCASNVCALCPVNAKFTVMGDLPDLYTDPRVELRLGADVQRLEVEGGQAKGVVFIQEGREQSARGELIALGANAVFNAAILLRSGDTQPWLGAGLNEQLGYGGRVYLDGLDGFDGSTSITGHGFMLYDGDHRREMAAALIETHNSPALRLTRDRWRQTFTFRVLVEDLPEERNRVVLGPGGKPELRYEGHSSYAERSAKALAARLERAFAALPIERFEVKTEPAPTEAHILGTTRMGRDASASVVDAQLVHHRYRNLLVLGSGTFPTSAPANPTLTLSALSMRAARKVASV